MPAEYHYEIAGEFQELQQALGRLAITVPASILIIFFLLYNTFRSLGDAALLLGVMPFAVTGGVLSLFITGTHFSISSAVSFLSLFGVYVLDGVILISQIKQLRGEGASLREAVERGAELRMRPVLMTALAAAIGLFPAAIATGIGSETQRPLARVVVGGILTSAADPDRAADDLSADASVAGTATTRTGVRSAGARRCGQYLNRAIQQ